MASTGELRRAMTCTTTHKLAYSAENGEHEKARALCGMISGTSRSPGDSMLVTHTRAYGGKFITNSVERDQIDADPDALRLEFQLHLKCEGFLIVRHERSKIW